MLQAAEKLGEGEFAKNLIETDDYFYISRMDSLFDQEATEQKRASIISDREDDMYQKALDGYKENAEWQVNDKIWKTVNFDTIYTKPQTQPQTDAQADETEDSSADANDDIDSDADTNESADINAAAEE